MAKGPMYVVNLKPLNASGVAQNWAYATEDCVTARPYSYGSVPVGSFVEGRIKHPGVIRYELFSGDRTFGASTSNSGAIVFDNTDGALDGWRDYNFEGTVVNQHLVFAGKEPGEVDSVSLQIEGYLGQPEFTESEVILPLRATQPKLDVPLQTSFYGGTNVLPNGLDGTADDIKGQPKPICLGIVRNATPLCVNTSRLIYQVHDKAFVNSASGNPWTFTAKDKGVAIGTGISRTLVEFNAGATDYTISSVDTALDQITLTAAFGGATGAPVHVWSTTGTVPAGTDQSTYYYARAIGGAVISLHPTAADATANTNIINLTSAGTGTIYVSTNQTPFGKYDWCNDATGFFFRLGSKAVGSLTFDARNNTSHGSSPTGIDLRYILNDLFTRQSMFVLGEDLDLGGVGTEDVGIYITEEATCRQIAAKFGESFAGALVGSGDYYNVYSIGDDPSVYEVAPGYTPRLDVKPSHVYSIAVSNTGDEWGEVVVWQVVYKYRKNWTIQNRSDIAGATEADIAFAEQEYRTVVVSDASVKTQYPNAKVLTVHSVLDDPTAANTVATQLLNRYKVKRKLIKVSVPLELDQVITNPKIDMGHAVRVTYPRFGLDSGVSGTVLGVQKNYDKDTMDLTLWR